MTAFKTHEEQEVGKIRFTFSSGTLWMVLPSGRKLAYLDPKQQPNRFGRMSLTYKGVGQEPQVEPTGNLLRSACRERHTGDCP